ncbi:MAG: O-methyltransferase [Eubacteriales bacterium]|nr:O-methyltransferase [Eubacteriales bacterium]
MWNNEIDGFLQICNENTDRSMADFEAAAVAAGIPIIRNDSQQLIRVLLKLLRPRKILEVGTAIGFSAILMARAATQAEITTIELDEQRHAQAEANFRQWAVAERIRAIHGDATEVLPQLCGQYDFIFLDGAKGQYLHQIDLLYGLLEAGGILLADNILQDGEVALSRYAVGRRDRTIHKRMREFIERIHTDSRFETITLSTGDGMLLARKN